MTTAIAPAAQTIGRTVATSPQVTAASATTEHEVAAVERAVAEPRRRRARSSRTGRAGARSPRVAGVRARISRTTKTRPAKASSTPSGPYHETNGDGGRAARVCAEEGELGTVDVQQSALVARGAAGRGHTARAAARGRALAATTTATSPAPRSPAADRDDAEHEQHGGADRVQPAVAADGACRVDGVDRQPRQLCGQPDVLGRGDALLVERREARDGVSLLDEVDGVPERADQRSPTIPATIASRSRRRRAEHGGDQQQDRQGEQRRRLRPDRERERERAERQRQRGCRRARK